MCKKNKDLELTKEVVAKLLAEAKFPVETKSYSLVLGNVMPSYVVFQLIWHNKHPEVFHCMKLYVRLVGIDCFELEHTRLLVEMAHEHDGKEEIVARATMCSHTDAAFLVFKHILDEAGNYVFSRYMLEA